MSRTVKLDLSFFFFQEKDGIRVVAVTGVQTCALPICTDGSESPCPDRRRRVEPLRPDDQLRVHDLQQGWRRAGGARRDPLALDFGRPHHPLPRDAKPGRPRWSPLPPGRTPAAPPARPPPPRGHPPPPPP